MRTIVFLAIGLLSLFRSLRFGRVLRVSGIAALVTAPGMLAAQEATPGASPVPIPTVGTTELIFTTDGSAGEFTEGVTVAGDGTVYVSVSPLGELVRVGEGGAREAVGQVPGLQPGDLGLLGIAAHVDGSIYGAVFSSNPDANGVWRFDVAGGGVERVPGTEQITMPNSIAFDSDGVMYVTDTIAGAVWTVAPDGNVELWFEHQILFGTGDLGFGFPVGANGIVIDGDRGVVQVAVTEQGTIVTIPVMDDGSAGEAAVLTRFDGMGMPDGVAMDGDGTIYVAQPAINTISRVSSDGTVDVLASGGNLDGPASVSVSADGEAVYIANFSAALAGLVPPNGAGPGVVMIPLED